LGYFLFPSLAKEHTRCYELVGVACLARDAALKRVAELEKEIHQLKNDIQPLIFENDHLKHQLEKRK
jgi:hypothetical protein